MFHVLIVCFRTRVPVSLVSFVVLFFIFFPTLCPCANVEILLFLFFFPFEGLSTRPWTREREEGGGEQGKCPLETIAVLSHKVCTQSAVQKEGNHSAAAPKSPLCPSPYLPIFFISPLFDLNLIQRVLLSSRIFFSVLFIFFSFSARQPSMREIYIYIYFLIFFFLKFSRPSARWILCQSKTD